MVRFASGPSFGPGLPRIAVLLALPLLAGCKDDSGPDEQGNVKVIDVSTGVGAANTFPQIGADIPVASNLGTPDSSLDYGNVTSFGIALSADEHLVFVAGSTRVVAVAVP